MTLRTTLGLTSLAAVVALALTGCAPASTGGAADTPSATSSASAEVTAFPRTITIPAGKTTAEATLTVAAEPQRIVALSYETTALAVELGLADKLVMIPEQAKNPALTDHADELANVETTLPTASEFDPELVIAQAPDLVLLTARHGLEDGAGKALQDAGVPVLILPNSWSTPAEVISDVTLVGEATGADASATALATELKTGLAPESSAAGSASPRILVLSNQAGRPFVTAGTAFPLDLVSLAGGSDVSTELGITATGPITAEQVIQAAPDGILLIDMNGSGEKSFASLLSNPAVAALPAVADGHVHRVSGKSVQALGLSSTIAGLTDLRDWIGAL